MTTTTLNLDRQPMNPEPTTDTQGVATVQRFVSRNGLTPATASPAR